MKIKKYICNLVAFAVLSGFALGSARAEAVVEGKWNYISSFNPNSTVSSTSNPNHVRKIMDGKRYAYFLVHGRSYLHSIADGTDYGTAAHPAAVLFRADNLEEVSTDRMATLEPVASIPGVGGTVVNNAEYNGAIGCLVIAYPDGTVTLLYDSGEVKTISDFSQMHIPGMKEIRNITFDTDNNRIYFAGTFGFFVLDAAKECVTDICISQKPLDYAFRCGDRMVAVTMSEYRKVDGSNKMIVGETLEAPYKEGLGDWNAFKPMVIDEEVSVFTSSTKETDIATAKSQLLVDGKMTGATWAAPFNERTICLMVNPKSNNTVSNSRMMTVLSPGEDGKWTLLWVQNQSLRTEQPHFSQMSLYEGYSVPWEKGWAAPIGSTYYMFDVSVAPDFSAANPINDYKNRAMTSKNLLPAGNSLQYKERRFSSYDAETGWVYEPFKGFRKAQATIEAGDWQDLTAFSLPNAPVVSVTPNMAWNAETGLVVRQFGQANNYNNNNLSDKDHLSIRRNGEWTDFSMYKTNPDYLGGYYDPVGAAIDPKYPNYVYGGSRFCGVIRRNVNDPSDVLFMGCPGDGSKNANLPGFVPAFPFQPSWKGICIAWTPKFDAKGNMWVGYTDFSKAEFGVYKWDRESIDASLEAHKNPELFQPLQSWNFKVGNVNNLNEFWPLSHESNDGLGIISIGNESDKFYIADFKSDASSPKLYSCEVVGNDNIYTDSNGTFDLYEDPQTGKVWFGTRKGLMWIQPSDIRNGNLRFYETAVTGFKCTKETVLPFETNVVYHIITDEKGRMWCGTNHGGLSCLSSDGNELLAHFNAENSPLESNAIMGLCWDGDTHSLIVSTYEGLFEFTPYEFCKPEDVESVRVWPSVVEPGYNGWVTFSGVPAGMTLALSDLEGSQVCQLPAAESGMIQWDVNHGGDAVPSGKYNVVEAASNRKLGEIVIY